MPRHIEVAPQLDLPIASVATKAADATGSAQKVSPDSTTGQLPLFQSVTDAVPLRPRVSRAHAAFRKLGELLQRQTSRTRPPDSDRPQSKIHQPDSAIP